MGKGTYLGGHTVGRFKKRKPKPKCGYKLVLSTFELLTKYQSSSLTSICNKLLIIDECITKLDHSQKTTDMVKLYIPIIKKIYNKHADDSQLCAKTILSIIEKFACLYKT